MGEIIFIKYSIMLYSSNRIMIPKIIHYCWFGKKPKSKLIEGCIESWKVNCSDFTITEWNEDTFSIESNPFTSKMYKEQKFAFVADYVRLIALRDHGGIYLDTDMLLIKPIDELLTTKLLLGKESDSFISCGMIGAVPHHPFIEEMRSYYDTITELKPNPVIMTELYAKLQPKDTLVLPPIAFYPYDAEHINLYKGQPLNEWTYGVHLWNYSWGHPLNKLFKKIGIHALGKKVVEILGIKKLLKRLLGFV
jgi:mannosyltransferase OCH1-like enzyme